MFIHPAHYTVKLLVTDSYIKREPFVTDHFVITNHHYKKKHIEKHSVLCTQTVFPALFRQYLPPITDILKDI